jgi:hypothetical protein
MSQLRNPKQEALAQGIFAGKTQLQAYKDAGYKGATTAASTKASQQPDVQVRLAELVRERHEAQRMANERALEQESITKAYLVSRLKFLADSSIRGTKVTYDKLGNASYQRTSADGNVAHSCLRTLAQMGGHLVEKVEIGAPGDFARLTDEELTRDLILVGESIGIPGDQIQKAIAGGAK